MAKLRHSSQTGLRRLDGGELAKTLLKVSGRPFGFFPGRARSRLFRHRSEAIPLQAALRQRGIRDCSIVPGVFHGQPHAFYGGGRYQR
jgi:hypothetical protein